MEFGTIAINDFHSLPPDSSALLADLRSPAEYRRSHIPEAVNLPFLQWQENPSMLQEYQDKTLYLYCEFGNISLLAARVLTDAGFRVFNLYGGLHSYRGPRTRQNTAGDISSQQEIQAKQAASAKVSRKHRRQCKSWLDADCDSVYNKQSTAGPAASKSQACCRKENGESLHD